MRPALALAAVAAVVFTALASRGVAFPVALASGLPVLAIGVLGSNPFPDNAAVLFGFAWIGLAVFLTSREEGALPLRYLLSPALVLTILLACWLLVRLSSSAETVYGSFKLQLFLVQGVLLLFAGILVGRRRAQLDRFVLLTLALATASSIVLARGLASGTVTESVGGRYSSSSAENPIELGRNAAVGLLVAVFLLLAARSLIPRLAALVAAPLIVVPFIAAGSRGPVVGLAVSLVVLLTLTARDPAARRRVLLVGLGGVVGFVLVSRLVPAEDVQRALSVLGGGEEGLNSNGRAELWGEAWSAFTDHPIAGVGTGGFAAIDPVERYPHNIFLEVAAELGAVGLALFAGILFVAMRSLLTAWRARGADRRHVALVAALLAAALVNAQFSSDLAANDAVWLAVGLSSGLALRSEGRRGIGRLRRRGDGEQHRPPAVAATGFALRRKPGAITRPAEGDRISGVVTVGGEPADTGWGIASVELQWSRDGDEWQSLGRAQEQPFDVYTIREGRREHVAVVRTRQLAEELAGSLPAGATADIVPSRRRPWQTGSAALADWDTTELAAGDYGLRVVTIDARGSRVESEAVTVTVVPPAPVAPARPSGQQRAQLVVGFDEPGQYLVGQLALRARVAGVGTAAVTLEARAGDRWRPLAVAQREPYVLSLDTRELSDGPQDLRLRALAPDGSSAVCELGPRIVDNTAPSCELVAPKAGESVAGIVKLRALAHDAGSNVKSILFQFAADGAASWRPVVTASSSRSSVDWNTTELDRGHYWLRVVCFDNANNVGATQPVAVWVDAAVPEPDPVEVAPPEEVAAVEVAAVEAAPLEVVPVAAESVSAPVAGDPWWSLGRLEHVVAMEPHDDPYAQAEREALLAELRLWADDEGRIPARFDQLLWETFGDPPAGT